MAVVGGCLVEGSTDDGGSWRSVLTNIGNLSGGNVRIIFSRSSTAIWWVSRSDSLDNDPRILCLSSTVARWEDNEEEWLILLGEC